MTVAQQFVALDRRSHDVKSFDCGKATMNEFLSRYAYKHNKQGLSQTMVLTANCQNTKQEIVAYHTLANATITREEIPIQSSLPRYPIPVILLARLAIHQQYQGQKLGEKTLITALQQAFAINKRGLPSYGVVLDVLDNDAMSFYQQFDFFSLVKTNQQKLFVAMQTLGILFEQ